MSRIMIVVAAVALGAATAACNQTTGYGYSSYSSNYYGSNNSYWRNGAYYSNTNAYQPGYYNQTPRRGPSGDYDRDGMPNRYDRDANGDGVPDRYQRR